MDASPNIDRFVIDELNDFYQRHDPQSQRLVQLRITTHAIPYSPTTVPLTHYCRIDHHRHIILDEGTGLSWNQQDWELVMHPNDWWVVLTSCRLGNLDPASDAGISRYHGIAVVSDV